MPMMEIEDIYRVNGEEFTSREAAQQYIDENVDLQRVSAFIEYLKAQGSQRISKPVLEAINKFIAFEKITPEEHEAAHEKAMLAAADKVVDNSVGKQVTDPAAELEGQVGKEGAESFNAAMVEAVAAGDGVVEASKQTDEELAEALIKQSESDADKAPFDADKTISEEEEVGKSRDNSAFKKKKKPKSMFEEQAEDSGNDSGVSSETSGSTLAGLKNAAEEAGVPIKKETTRLFRKTT